MKVRTSIGALVTGAILSGALAIAAVGDGRSSDARPASPAPNAPMRPDSSLPTFHHVVKNGAHAPASAQPQPAAPGRLMPAIASGPDLDAYVLAFLRGGLTYLALFLAAHLGLRRLGVASRWAYAGLGAVAAAGAVATLTPLPAWGDLIATGRLSQYLGIVAFFGAIIGFLYVWRAGLSAEEDDPTALARTVGDRAGAPDASPSGDDAALVAIDAAEYFDGPLQVRTSFPVMFVAAIVSAGLYCTGITVLGAASDLTARLHASIPLLGDLGGALETRAVLMLGTGAITAFPATFLILLTHYVLRGLNKQSYLAYGAGGLLAPVLLGLIAGPLGALVGAQAMVPMAIAMSVYRNMAGVEPKPVKEDILVRDRRHLVGAQHPRRQYGRVVKA